MSEYQYYEFRAFDRPLDARARAQLRRITSRAEITATSLVNEYHYGDFKGDPAKLVARHFDAFVYVSNWGSYQLMLRLPAGVTLPAPLQRAYASPTVRFAKTTSRQVVVDLGSECDGRELDDEPGGWMASLAGLRDELAAGDHRALYVGWLRGVQEGAVEDDTLEPPVPAGLGRPSAALAALVTFLDLDETLLAQATMASPRGPAIPAVPVAEVLRRPAAEKDRLLRRFLSEPGGRVLADLRPAPVASGRPRRTAAELRARAGLD